MHVLADEAGVVGTGIEFDLVGGTAFGRTEEDAAVATPRGFNVHGQIEVLVALIGEEETSLSVWVLAKGDCAVLHGGRSIRAVMVGFTPMPAVKGLAVEEQIRYWGDLSVRKESNPRSGCDGAPEEVPMWEVNVPHHACFSFAG